MRRVLRNGVKLGVLRDGKVVDVGSALAGAHFDVWVPKHRRTPENFTDEH